MIHQNIPATIVNGFLDAGKTTYIQDCLKNDFFYKRGKTLLVSFEEGEEEYCQELLKSRRTDLIVYPGHGDITLFLQNALETYHPDRLYVEMNAMTDHLLTHFPDEIRVTFSITLIDGTTLDLYYRNMRQKLQDMITISHQVIFNHCQKETLVSYGNIFRIMNHKAVYLWEGPTGYHEKAFGVMVPYDLDQAQLILTDDDFTPFYLDSLSMPERYSGKQIQFLCQVKKDTPNSTSFRVGRQVMTCCLADIQFLSFACECSDPQLHLLMAHHAWIHLTAKVIIRPDRYGQKSLLLRVTDAQRIGVPEKMVIGL